MQVVWALFQAGREGSGVLRFRLRGSTSQLIKERRNNMARKFIVDGTEYPDPGPDVTPEQFKQMMVGFLPELANADMTTEKQGEDTIYRFKKRVGVKG
jgi:PRTRC genetic system protein C